MLLFKFKILTWCLFVNLRAVFAALRAAQSQLELFRAILQPAKRGKALRFNLTAGVAVADHTQQKVAKVN